MESLLPTEQPDFALTNLVSEEAKRHNVKFIVDFDFKGLKE